MQFTDLEGKLIEITDLDKAIEQAEMFKDFRHIRGNYKKLDKKLRMYWSDVYLKLMKLKKMEKSPESCRSVSKTQDQAERQLVLLLGTKK